MNTCTRTLPCHHTIHNTIIIINNLFKSHVPFRAQPSYRLMSDCRYMVYIHCMWMNDIKVI